MAAKKEGDSKKNQEDREAHEGHKEEKRKKGDPQNFQETQDDKEGENSLQAKTCEEEDQKKDRQTNSSGRAAGRA